MKLIEAEARIRALAQPVIHTSDAAALLGVPGPNASKMLGRLLESGVVLRLTRGRWLVIEGTDRLAIPEHLAALFYHRMISQIPNLTYAVTTARTRRYVTPLGTFSIHHLDPGFFFGFEPMGPNGIKVATPEKALLDYFYLGPARSKLFGKLPEIEFPKGFNLRKIQDGIATIRSPSRRTLVAAKFEELWRR